MGVPFRPTQATRMGRAEAWIAAQGRSTDGIPQDTSGRDDQSGYLGEVANAVLRSPPANPSSTTGHWFGFSWVVLCVRGWRVVGDSLDLVFNWTGPIYCDPRLSMWTQGRLCSCVICCGGFLERHFCGCRRSGTQRFSRPWCGSVEMIGTNPWLSFH